MNRLQALLNREQGLTNKLDYDFALRRLCVAKEDSWRGIVPSNFGSDFNPEPPIFSAKFANCDGYRHILAIANEDGKIALQDTTKRNDQPMEQALTAPQCHYNAVFDLEWAPGQMKFVSASGDHTARLWEVTGSEIRNLRTFMGHTRSVKTAAFRRNDPTVFATGGRDGAIIIWDTRANLNIDLTPRVDNCIYSGHGVGPSTPQSVRKRARISKLPTNAASSSITGLAFQDINTLISCGAGDGVIKVWDLRRNYMVYKKEPLPKHSLPYAGSSTFKGFTNLIVDASGSRLYANCMDNTIYCYNLCSYAPYPLERYKGLLNSTFYIKACLSPDGKYLISGSSDEKAYIWNLNYADEPLLALEGHTVEVTCVAWGATHDCPIVTCSDDARHKIWRIGAEHVNDAELKSNFCGTAVQMRKLQPKSKNRIAANYFDLATTPRTLKRWKMENESTPGGAKRMFADMLTEATETEKEENNAASTCSSSSCEEPNLKRPRLLESRGRRLFNSLATPNLGNHATCSVSSNNTSPVMRCYNVEITAAPAHQETLLPNSPQGSDTTTTTTTTPNKGESANRACTINGEPTSMIYSPTSNLPNYVMDGEAPHMAVMSPKRKIKQKVDWLTKIRKQKLMSSCRNGVLTLADKLNNENEHESTYSEKLGEESSDYKPLENCNIVSSPRLQSLRATEGSPRIIATPRRRSSQDGRHSQPRTPTSSRQRSLETNTLLRFFSKQCPSIREHEDEVEGEKEDRGVNTSTATTSTIAANTINYPISPCGATAVNEITTPPSAPCINVSNMAPDSTSGNSVVV